MARPRRVSNEQILATTRQLLLAKGGRISLDAIGAKLSMTAPALLKRFGNRELLFREALQPPNHTEIYLALRKDPKADEPFEHQLGRLFELQWRFLIEWVPRLIALKECGVSEKHDNKVKDRWRRVIRGFQRWLNSAERRGLVRPGNNELRAVAMLGSLQARALSAHLLWRASARPAGGKDLKDLAQLFARGIAGESPGRKTPKRRENRI